MIWTQPKVFRLAPGQLRNITAGDAVKLLSGYVEAKPPAVKRK